MPSPLARRVRETIRRRSLLGGDDRVVVALSAGGDSAALVALLGELAPKASWRLVGLVHVNHGLRGEDSDADESYCRDCATRLGWPLHVSRVNVRARARVSRISIESAAREARYEVFDEALQALGGTVVATGHTQDDQAETVMLRLLRGAGTRGISAIRPRRDRYVRPLIDCRREELRAYLATAGHTFREDRTNADLQVPRNRLRHTLMRTIESDWPGGVPALARLADLATDDEAWMEAAARELSARVVRIRGGGVQIDMAPLRAAPVALVRRVVHSAVLSLGRTPSFRDVEAVRRLGAPARGTSGGPGRRADRRSLDLDGILVELCGEGLTLSKRVAGTDARVARARPAWERALPIPGVVEVGETGMTISASMIKGAHPDSLRIPKHMAMLRADTLARPLLVRTRRPGDRLRPFGAAGSRKLQDVLVDGKVPQGDRDRVPIVVDATGRIVWVAGLTMSEECRVTTAESGVVVLELKKGKQ